MFEGMPEETKTEIDAAESLASELRKYELSLVDSSFAHCTYSNNPQPETSVARDVRWERWHRAGTVFVTDAPLVGGYSPLPGTRTAAWLLEPRSVMPGVYEHVRRNQHQYWAILSHDQEFFGGTDAGFSPRGKRPSNYLWTPVGGCWIPEADRWDGVVDLNHEYRPGRGMKTVPISAVFSHKMSTEGHWLRHRILEMQHERIEVRIVNYGSGGKNTLSDEVVGVESISAKHEAFDRNAHPFQVVVENSRTPGYFTEKIIDCFATGTIPIYWGCPDLARYGFSEDGVIRFEDERDLFERVLPSLPSPNAALGDPRLIDAAAHNARTARDYYLAEDFISANYGEELMLAESSAELKRLKA